jgi:hypothetical protein
MTDGTSKCGVCGATRCRLYRPYGEFRRPERDRCNAHVLEDERGWYVPLVLDNDGSVWGFTSAPPRACGAFYALPEASSDRPGWQRIGGWNHAH